ncbi:MAG: hypothetical protein ACP5UQ_02315 [Anaerolineae bacterium]
MQPIRRLFWISPIILLAATLACSSMPRLFPSADATPTAQGGRSQAILPTASRGATARPSTAVVRPGAATASPAPTTGLPRTAATAAPTSSVTATPDPHLIIITEEDIARAITAGAGAEQGLSAQGLQVRFRDGQMTLSADELSLGPVQVKQLVMVGRLVADNGELHFESDSVSPRGLVTSLLPTLADQALSRYASRWYVEAVRLLDGRLELRIR